MIKYVTDLDGSSLRESHYSRLIRAHLEAYGTGFDFCRFYRILHLTGGKTLGALCVFNGSLVAELCGGVRPTGDMRREIKEFVDFLRPAAAELPAGLAPKGGFSGYRAVERRFFEAVPAKTCDGLFSPEPQTAFQALGMPRECYPVWLTDTLRRVSRGLSELDGYKTSVLTVRFMTERLAFVSDLATPKEDRGKGQAGELLGRTARKMADSGRITYLCAAEELYGFYEKLGCRTVGSDVIYLSENN